MDKKVVLNVLSATLLTAGAAGISANAHANVDGVFITEFMGLSGPANNGWVEFTNLTQDIVDFSEYGYFKNTFGAITPPGGPFTKIEQPDSDFPMPAQYVFDASKVVQLDFSSVAPGESVILTTACDSIKCEEDEGEPIFHHIWNLPASVQVQNLGAKGGFSPGSSSQLSLYRLSDGMLMHQVNYTTALSQTGFSASATTLAFTGTTDQTGWVKSAINDDFSSFYSSEDYYGAVGNPGSYPSLGNDLVTTPVPEPEAYAMMLIGLGLVGLAIRRRKQSALLCQD
jgi:hypothetical protein